MEGEKPTRMNKQQVARAVQMRLGIDKDLADDVVFDTITVISEALSRGETVHLAELGRFYMRNTKARMRGDISTGGKKFYPETQTVAFKPYVKIDNRNTNPEDYDLGNKNRLPELRQTLAKMEKDGESEEVKDRIKKLIDSIVK